jgi:hypothetical protein
MKKTFIAGIFTIFALATGAGNAAVNAAPSEAFTTANEELITVHINLVNPATGNPVTNHGLQGYWAQNQSTGEYYYSGYNDNFEALPEGTYLFGAFNGYWDGASSSVVTIDAANGNYAVVTLHYWSE